MRPAWRITLGDLDLSPRIASRLLSIEVEDKLGGEADALRLTLDDRDPPLAIPAPGTALTVALGPEGALHDLGSFLIERTEISGPARIMNVTARAADLSGPIRAPRSQAWTGRTLAEIAEEVATRNGLEARVSPDLGSHVYTQVEQASESDLNLMTRLGRDLDAVAKVADGKLVIAPQGAVATVSGARLVPVAVQASALSGWSWRGAARSAFGQVKARWGDRKGGALADAIEGNGGDVLEIRRVLASEPEARAAASRKHAALKRQGEELRLSFATFRGDLAAGSIITISGLREGVDGRWSLSSLRHRLDASGLLTEATAGPVAEQETANG